MSIEVTVNCDGCAVLMAAGKTAAAARVDARQNGAATGLPGGRDLCNVCRPSSKVSIDDLTGPPVWETNPEGVWPDP